MQGSKANVIEILDKLRQALNKKGQQTMRCLAKTFQTMDTDGNRKVDPKEFIAGLKSLDISLTTPESEALFAYFDSDKDGSINLDEFLVGIRGRPNKKRQALIDKAFLKFDKNGDGSVDASELKPHFNFGFHPKVVSGEMTDD